MRCNAKVMELLAKGDIYAQRAEMCRVFKHNPCYQHALGGVRRTLTIQPVIPNKANRNQLSAFDKSRYRNHNVIERMF